MLPMTKRQLQIYNFIIKHINENGYSPTIREIGKAVGLKSSSTTHRHVRNLVNKGHITLENNRPRTINFKEG